MASEEKTNAQLGEQLDEMSNLIKKQDGQLLAFGETKEALGKKIDEQDARIMELVESVDEHKKRQDELEAKGNRHGFGGESVKSAGEEFLESDVFTAAADGGILGNPYKFKRGLIPSRHKDLTSAALSAGALVAPMRIAEIVRAPDRAFRIRDLLSGGVTGSNSIEYVEETGFANLAAILTATAAAAQADVVVDNVNGLTAGQTIQVGSGATIETKIIGSIVVATKTVTLTTNLANEQVTGEPFVSTTFSPTGEGLTKPKANIIYELKSTPIRTLAHWIPASRQILADAGQLRSQIDQRLLYGLQLAEEQQILYGDGTGQNLQGILSHTSIQTYSWSSGPLASDTRIDALRRAMTLARIAEYPITGVVLHPTDWESIELLKGSDKHYIWINVTTGGEQRLFRVPVVDTTAILAGTALLGAFQLGATVYDREQASIRVSEHHEDYFAKNMVAILAENREALAIFRPEAFVNVTFDTAPTP